jgi:cell division protein FtsZ
MNNLIQFEMPSRKSSIIKVIGVGGGGGNAVNYMHKQGIEGVDFVLCNTDAKALEQSDIPLKIQLGPTLTQGLGAGADPQIGEGACKESIEELENILKDNTKMVFVTAGMGGGTGTGAAPVISEVAKKLGILTVGIVTTPFNHEGPRRKLQAENGISKMREYVDTILVVSNDKVRQQYGNVGFKNAFSRADDILATATKCITDIINSRGHVIVDFADVCTVMRNGGVAILGNAVANGENRAQEAIDKALNSPLLNDNNIEGARWVLININSAEGEHEFTLDENEIIQEYVRKAAGKQCDVILGLGIDESLVDAISVTVIATGFNQQDLDLAFEEKELDPHEGKTVLTLQQDSSSDQHTDSKPTAPTLAVAPLPIAAEDIVVPGLAPAMMPQLKELTSDMAVPKVLGLAMRPIASAVQAPLPSPVLTIPDTVMQSSSTFVDLPSTTAPQVAFDQATEPTRAESSPSISHLNADATQPFGSAQSSSTEVPFNLEPTAEPRIARTVMPDNFEVLGFAEQVVDDIVTIEGVTFNRKRGSRYMSEDEIREYISHEHNKRRFEDRASQLRTVSHVISKPEVHSELEHVPSYLRQGMELNHNHSSAAPAASAVSTYGVDGNGNLDSKNEFLDGEVSC